MRAYPPTPSTLLPPFGRTVRGWGAILKEYGLLLGLAGALLIVAVLISIM